MRSIHIGICHNDDLVITQLRNIKIVSETFRKSTAESIDHRLDLCIGKYFVDRCLFHI